MVELFTNSEQLEAYLKALGEVLCQVLEIFPYKQFNFTVTVSDDCFLEFTIAKKS